jgi:hypothetical protein
MKKSTTYLFILFFIVNVNFVLGQSIVINEILTSNAYSNTDEDGTHQDWIELYNNGATTVNLSGYGLSDDVTLLHKWVFPNVSVAAGQYLLVWCSDKNRTVVGSPLHTNFKISSSGEVISLTNPSGTTVDSVPATVISQDNSYGRLPNGTGSFVFFASVTPNAVNSTAGYNEVLSPPTFSQESGFLTSDFNLTLSTAVPGSTILYTLDGSEPKASNLGGTTYSYKNQYPEHIGQATGTFLNKNFRTFQYSTPLAIVDRSSQPNKIAAISTTYSFNPTYIPPNPLFKGTVVRAKLTKSGALDSKTVTKTYYISPQGISRFSLPVVSLSLDENKLYDYNNGIYVAGKDFDDWRTANPNLEPEGIEDIANYYRRGIANERVANMTYFVNGAQVLNQDVGLRVHGGTSRDFQSKSFNIYARSDYGDDNMSYKFFSDRSFDNFSGLVLRNSGNDFTQTMFRDALCQELMKSLNVITKGYQPTITFMNGEYWGILNLRDKIDDNYFQRVFNIPTTEIDVLESNATPEEGDDVDYLALINYVTNNSLTVQANYDYIKTQLDPESFKDYFISNIFFGNEDWPGNNIVYWRKKTAAYEPNAPFGHDGRWRWLAHDMDDTFAVTSANINLNSLAAATATNGPAFPNPAWSTLLLRKMLDNPGFKTEFINRFADLLNTSFLSSRVLAEIAEMKAVIEPEMPQQIARWKAPIDNDEWNYFLDGEIAFATQRPAFQRNHIRSQFGISANINATLNVSDAAHGFIKMNTINVLSGTPGITANPYPWTGIYFSGVPVTLKAIANPGFAFSHWTGASASTNPEITITSATNFSVTAVFVTETVAASHPIYYWMMNANIPNDTPLEILKSTYKTGIIHGMLQYQSCLVGYPFTAADLNWRKASMERRNSPTEINYTPEANGNLPFATSDMKGLQIREPLQKNGLENIMEFDFDTSGYRDIKFSFAAINELTNASNIVIDYAVNPGTPVWITDGLAATSLPLTAAYQLFNINFTSITTANNNADFKVRLRFSGTNMTADTGGRITFNNIAVHGTQQSLTVVDSTAIKFSVYPNPFSDIINVTGVNQTGKVHYKVFTIDGKMIKNETFEDSQINLNELSKGMYLLQLSFEGKLETRKIIKK